MIMQFRISNRRNKNSKLDKTYLTLFQQNGITILNKKGTRGGWDVTVQFKDNTDFALFQYLVKYDFLVKLGAIIIEDAEG